MSAILVKITHKEYILLVVLPPAGGMLEAGSSTDLCRVIFYFTSDLGERFELTLRKCVWLVLTLIISGVKKQTKQNYEKLEYRAEVFYSFPFDPILKVAVFKQQLRHRFSMHFFKE